MVVDTEDAGLDLGIDTEQLPAQESRVSVTFFDCSEPAHLLDFEGGLRSSLLLGGQAEHAGVL